MAKDLTDNILNEGLNDICTNLDKIYDALDKDVVATNDLCTRVKNLEKYLSLLLIILCKTYRFDINELKLELKKLDL